MGIPEGIGGGVGEFQDSAAAQGGDQCNEKRKTQAQPDHIAHKVPKTMGILFTEFLGHGNGEAAADAVAQAQHHKGDGAGGAYACQRLHPQEIAHHGGVHHGIELLENHAHHQRKHEGQHNRQGRAGGHISCAFFSHCNASSLLLGPAPSPQLPGTGQGPFFKKRRQNAFTRSA